MVGGSLLDLQRAALNGKTVFERAHDVVHKRVAWVACWHDRMNRQGAFGGTHAPDVKVVNGSDGWHNQAPTADASMCLGTILSAS